MSEPWSLEQIYDIDFLKQEVGKRFPFYDIKVSPSAIAFYCNIDKDMVEELFDSLRRVLAEKNYIPTLRYEGGEYILYIMKQPVKKEKPIWVNIVLLISTIITTLLTGSLLDMGYSDLQSVPDIYQVFTFEHLLNGAIFFSLPLMSILFVHEMGHYFISKKHGIRTSLPFFIPVPPILPGFNIGTFGALISSRDPMPDRKALFDVGFSGPLAGFLVALPITIYGLATSSVISPSDITGEGGIYLGYSPLFFILAIMIHGSKGVAINLNPVAFAGWIGLLITSINLLPAGQLDGGHIFRAILGEKQRYAGWIAITIMIFTGWMFFALIIMFLIGMRHPPPLNDTTEIDLKRKLLFVLAILILVLCFVPFPIYPVE